MQNRNPASRGGSRPASPDARHQPAKHGVWVAIAAQAGSTINEDVPGIAALIDPHGTIVSRLPDWRPGCLIVDIPDAPRDA